MRLAFRICGALLLFGAAATVSDAGTNVAHGACTASAARPLVVTNFGDNVDHPAKGTLRNILLDMVRPGQTITFCDTTPIELAGSLGIPSTDGGVTISGGAIGSPELRPAAVDIKASGLRIVGTSFYELRVIVEAGQVSFTGDSFRQRRTDEPYLVLAENAPGLRIGDDTFDSHAQAAIAVQRSDKVSVIGNTITTGGDRFAFEGDNDPGLRFDDNTTDGDVISQAQSGTISHNTLNGPGGGGGSSSETAIASGKHLSNAQAIAAARKAGLGLYVLTDGFSRVGHMAIEGNHIDNAALDVERPNVTIDGNIVAGGTGMGITCGYPDEPSRAPIAIGHNQVSGTRKGVRYRCSAQVKATLDGNTVSDGKQYGIFVDAAEAILQANKVQGNRQRGIDVNCPGGATGGSLALTGNKVSTNGTGITVTCGAPAVASKLDRNAVTDNHGAGIVVARSSGGTAITGGLVQANHGDGIKVSPGASVSVSGVAMGGNTGVGIDSTAVAPPVVRYSGRKIRGVACGGCLVEAYSTEAGLREGNPHNGEGAAVRGQVRAGADGTFVYPAACDEATGTVKLTFTVTRGEGATADTSGFSADAACKPPFIDVYVHLSFGGTCRLDSEPQKITDPTDSKPVYYYFYFTSTAACNQVHGAAWAAGNYDALKAAEKAEAEARPKKPETESSDEDWTEAVLPIPAFPPNTTIYATRLQTCSPYDPHPSESYRYPPPCGTGTRVVVEVFNHEPNG